MLITPTNSCLGRLDPESISRLDSAGNLLSGKPPSKELFLHRAYYDSRVKETAVVHLHSTWSVAVSCLADVDPENVLPAITAYYVMRVGRLPLIPYFAPGNRDLAAAVASASRAAGRCPPGSSRRISRPSCTGCSLRKTLRGSAFIPLRPQRLYELGLLLRQIGELQREVSTHEQISGMRTSDRWLPRAAWPPSCASS